MDRHRFSRLVFVVIVLHNAQDYKYRVLLQHVTPHDFSAFWTTMASYHDNSTSAMYES